MTKNTVGVRGQDELAILVTINTPAIDYHEALIKGKAAISFTF
jgi:hypothetical protein